MADAEKDSATAMELAERAYLYSLFHAVFGGKPTVSDLNAECSDRTNNALLSAQNMLHKRNGALISEDDSLAEEGPTIATALEGLKTLLKKGVSAGSLEELQSAYGRLFEIPGKSYVHPWESTYVSDEPMVFRESTLDVRSYYHAAGFRLKAEKHFPDDHIAAMMDFMAHLAQQTYESFADGNDAAAQQKLLTQKAFINHHISSWVAEFAQNVADNDDTCFYAIFAWAMVAWIAIDRENTQRLADMLA